MIRFLATTINLAALVAAEFISYPWRRRLVQQYRVGRGTRLPDRVR